MNNNRHYPAFSIIVIFTMLMIIGISLLPLLNIQLNPSRALPQAQVSYNWSNASARVIEQEITSKLEGTLSQINGLKEISSVSKKGRGSISLSFKKGSDLDVLRFEMATLIRQVYPSFPEGVSYPVINLKTPDDKEKQPLLTYTLNANANSMYIQQYAENNLADQISLINGVNDVQVYGGTPYEWQINIDNSLTQTLGISSDEVAEAINIYFRTDILGIASQSDVVQEKTIPMQIVLKSTSTDSIEWSSIPVKKVGQRIIFLGDIAKVRYQEQLPISYFRINGMNTINMVIYPEDNVNNLKVAQKVKQKIENIQRSLPAGYSILMAYDATEFIGKELNKIGLRTIFSLIILLVFVVIVSRNLRYLLLLFISIVANLLIACIFYYVFKIEIHLYALAGITVSFGIIIDNSIIMIDHIRNRGNRKVFLAILAATLTTIGALSVIFFLKEEQRINLIDFSLVVIINLAVSLFIALFFIPALMVKLPLQKRKIRKIIRLKRRVLHFNRIYIKSIRISKKLRWLYFLVFILGFGLPVFWLPDKIDEIKPGAGIYNKTLGSDWYQNSAKPIVDKALGGSLRLFVENVYESSFYSEPDRTTLFVRGNMPEGCTVQQMNEAIKKMENFIAEFNEVDIFQTNIYSPQNASITIYFKEEFELGSFPYMLKEELTTRAIQLGGLDWGIYGVGRGFSNALHTGGKNSRIILEGYNYDELYDYAEKLSENLTANPRVRDIEITGSTSWRTESLHEYYLDFNREKFALNNLNLVDFYGRLKNTLYKQSLQSIFNNGELQQVSLISSETDKYNVWDIDNEPVNINHNMYKLKDLGSIQKRKTGNSIHKKNQQYQLVVAYDFIGPPQLSEMVRNEHIDNLRQSLPLGYSVNEQKYSGWWDKKDKKQYYLIFLVIAIIYFICSILLESLRQPLAIIGMIPISFIGVFLTFYLFDFNFDQGGFASFILLCGIVVNAGLYIINDFNQQRKKYPNLSLQRAYIKAYNHKIIPIILTILSTILGLVPFIWNSQNEVFWFAFAVGAIGGLIFSLVALVIGLPLFIKLKR